MADVWYCICMRFLHGRDMPGTKRNKQHQPGAAPISHASANHVFCHREQSLQSPAKLHKANNVMSKVCQSVSKFHKVPKVKHVTPKVPQSKRAMSKSIKELYRAHTFGLTTTARARCRYKCAGSVQRYPFALGLVQREAEGFAIATRMCR